MPFGNAISTASYNAYTFSAHMETVSVDSRAGYDEAGRTVTRMIYVIRLKDRVYHADDTGDAVENIRRRLSVPGKMFTYTNHGFGDFTINSTDAKDTNWGPKPRVISWSPVGGVRAWEFVWEVEVSIPECDQAASAFAIMEFNYQLAIDIDISGYTTRTYTGHLIIPQTRVDGGRTLQDTADKYWSRVQPAVPASFRRVRRERTIDKSKSRLDFIIGDEEIGPNFFPEGAVEAKLSHSLTSDNRAFVKWIGNIQAEYEIDRAITRSKAYNHFVDFLTRRLKLARDAFLPYKTGQTNNVRGFILPCRFSMKENDAYGRATSSFSFDYIMYQPLHNILKASALWTPLGNDYYQWKSSLKNKSQDPRGNARLEFNPADDAIVDLCQGSTSVAFTDPVTNFQGAGGTTGTGTGTLGGGETPTTVGSSDDQIGFTSPVLGANPPTVDESWMHYELTMEASTTSYVMEHKPLPITDQAIVPPEARKYNPAYVIEKGRLSPPSRIQHLNSNDNSITLVGKAIRCGFDIPRPKLVKIGDREPIEQNREGIEFFRTQILTSFAFPVVVATFRLRWIIPNVDGPLGTMLAASTPLLHRPDTIPPDGQQIKEPL